MSNRDETSGFVHLGHRTKFPDLAVALSVARGGIIIVALGVNNDPRLAACAAVVI